MLFNAMKGDTGGRDAAEATDRLGQVMIIVMMIVMMMMIIMMMMVGRVTRTWWGTVAASTAWTSP